MNTGLKIALGISVVLALILVVMVVLYFASYNTFESLVLSNIPQYAEQKRGLGVCTTNLEKNMKDMDLLIERHNKLKDEEAKLQINLNDTRASLQDCHTEAKKNSELCTKNLMDAKFAHNETSSKLSKCMSDAKKSADQCQKNIATLDTKNETLQKELNAAVILSNQKTQEILKLKQTIEKGKVMWAALNEQMKLANDDCAARIKQLTDDLALLEEQRKEAVLKYNRCTKDLRHERTICESHRLQARTYAQLRAAGRCG